MTTPTDASSVHAAGLPGWSWTVDPPEGWLVVPSTVTEPAEMVAEWEREVTVLVRDLFEEQAGEPGQPGEAAEPNGAERVLLDQLATDSVANLRAFADGMAPDGHRVAAALGVMDNGPVPVLVAVGVSDPAEPDDGLMAALGATGGEPAMSPNIEHLDLPDGDGVRVTRLDVDGLTGGAWISISVGRRVEHADAVVDTVLVWRSMDLFVAAAMGELLDELLPAVHVTRSET